MPCAVLSHDALTQGGAGPESPKTRPKSHAALTRQRGPSPSAEAWMKTSRSSWWLNSLPPRPNTRTITERFCAAGVSRGAAWPARVWGCAQPSQVRGTRQRALNPMRRRLRRRQRPTLRRPRPPECGSPSHLLRGGARAAEDQVAHSAADALHLHLLGGLLRRRGAQAGQEGGVLGVAAPTPHASMLQAAAPTLT